MHQFGIELSHCRLDHSIRKPITIPIMVITAIFGYFSSFVKWTLYGSDYELFLSSFFESSSTFLPPSAIVSPSCPVWRWKPIGDLAVDFFPKRPWKNQQGKDDPNNEGIPRQFYIEHRLILHFLWVKYH